AEAHDLQDARAKAAPNAALSISTSRCMYSWASGTSLAGPDGSTAGAWAFFSGGPLSCRGGLLPGQLGPPHPFWVVASPRRPQRPVGVAPEALAASALSRSALPAADFRTWPPNGRGVVNFPTWVHAESWAPVFATA